MIFPDIEAYIEFIGGYRDKNNNTNWWLNNPLPIQLATYDIGFVQSVTESTLIHNTPMSTKQAALAEQLIKKYAKQLSKMGVEQPNHQHYRLGQRTVIHTNSLTLEDNALFFRFTFDNSIILTIKQFAKDSQGAVLWNKDKKAWVFALTEYNISWVVTYAQSKNIQVSGEVLELFNLVLEEEKNAKPIELQLIDGKFSIRNAPDSLREYVEKYIGYDNIYSLVDNAGVLGYSIDPEILDSIADENGEDFAKLCANRQIDIQSNMFNVLQWAKVVNRLPICVYNPNFLKVDMTTLLLHFEEDEVQIMDLKNKAELVDPTKKVVYTNKVIPWEGRMPLLITYANLMHGVSKREFANKAEKTVFFCPPLPKR